MIYGSWAETIPAATIQQDILQRPDLTPSARSVFAFLWRATHQQRNSLHDIFFGVPYMARELGLSTRTVRRAIHLLAEIGLITIIPRVRRTAPRSPSSHRYKVHWRPYVPLESSVVERDSATDTTPLDADDGRPVITPDTSFAFPNVSGGAWTSCQEGEDGESEAPYPPDTHAETAIDQNQGLTNEISTPHIAGAPIYRFPSREAFLLFLLTHLSPRGIVRRRLQQWIKAYGFERVAIVSQWVLSAPKGVIRNAGAWMHRALQDNWSAPSWVREVWQAYEERVKNREHRRRDRDRLEALKSQVEESAIRRAREAEEWLRVENAWAQLPDSIVAVAERLAQAELRTQVGSLFNPGHPVIWRTYILRAVRTVCPEILESSSHEGMVS